MLHDKHKQWIEGRMIDPVIADKFGLETHRDSDGYWLRVPYLERGEVINHKWRQTSEKRHRMDTGAPLLLWNADVLSDPEVLAGAPVVITEGEWDALAAMTSGVPYVVSVPNGAPAQATDEPEKAKRYEWVWRHLDALAKVKQFIIAADGDEAGRNLAADLVTLLGADRCRFITYPEPCKDLNDVVLTFGHARVVEIIGRAKPYPVQGLYKFSAFPPRAIRPNWSVGLPMLDDYIRIVPGTLTAFTGYANIGKSTVLSSIIAAQIKNNIPVCIASFETDMDILRDSLRQAIIGCSSYDLTKIDTSEADALIEENSTVIYQAVDADFDMDLDAFLELCRVSVLQHGVKMIVLDPWNELEHKMRRDETETTYTNRALREFRRFAERWNVAFWVVAHPAKPMPGQSGVPKGYQISGSAAWANKPHYGLTYHRRDPSANAAELHVWKVKQGLPGKKTDKDGIPVMLDFRNWQFTTSEIPA